MKLQVFICLLLCSLCACGPFQQPPPGEVYWHPQSQPQSQPRAYQVKKGDTLYSIAFRYGLDHRHVAAINYIPAPYTIYPGQYILLREVDASQPSVPTPEPADSEVKVFAAPGVAVVPVVTHEQQTAEPVARQPAPVAGSSSAPPPIVTPVATPVATTVVTPTQNPASAASPEPAPIHTTKAAPAPVPTKPASGSATQPAPTVFVGTQVNAWLWPTKGAVIRGYSDSVHKGVDIGGERGDAVSAVAAGKVVYAGNGIVGFGELLIVKHNEVYLSAYGHNDRLLVSEGDVVRAGQQIAQKGSSGTDTVKLHFEIRKEGKPIDPQRLLPRR